MKTLLLLITTVSFTSAFIDENALAILRTLDHWNAFRFVLKSSVHECFHVDVKQNDTLHVIYQVLSGGNSQIDITILKPSGDVAFSRLNSAFDWYDNEHLTDPGIYSICLRHGQYFTTKTVYLAVLAVQSDVLAQANLNSAEESNNNGTAAIENFSMNAMQSLVTITGTLYRLTAYQTVGRVQHAHDLYWVDANARYVQNWAICQIVVMLVCATIQVFSIRRLFTASTAYKKSSTTKYNQQTSAKFIF